MERVDTASDSPTGMPGWMHALLVCWLVVLGASFVALANYQANAGPAAQASDWPASTTLVRGTAPTLVLFLHPECGCSRATLAELRRLLPRIRATLHVQIVMSGAGDLLRDGAQAITGATVQDDPACHQARVFGATTSGHTFLFDGDGHLLFHGGVTAARGHEGPNRGVDAILACLATESPAVRTTPVFGCPLYAPVAADDAP